MRRIVLLATHTIALVVGFALGIYALPILTAADSPDQDTLTSSARDALYSASFNRDLRGSDFLHWGEGSVSVTPQRIIHMGKLAPGPDYKLYLVPEFAEDTAGFLALKDRSVQLGDVKSFNGVIVDVPAHIDVNDFNTVLIWCEAFGAFITAAQYK